LFAGAHWSHGPDPIPLFFFALVLGYLYQRTRRILPCVVVHFLLNSCSLAALWLDIYGGAAG
jgi:membrane protease YdiL (CAAX protease family)